VNAKVAGNYKIYHSEFRWNSNVSKDTRRYDTVVGGPWVYPEVEGSSPSPATNPIEIPTFTEGRRWDFFWFFYAIFTQKLLMNTKFTRSKKIPSRNLLKFQSFKRHKKI
jgi:hypothetical protein